jgi:hypothetical protein
MKIVKTQKDSAAPQCPASSSMQCKCSHLRAAVNVSHFTLLQMLETPPCPYLISTDNGCPVLLFGSDLQQLQQQQQAKQHADAQFASAAASSAPGSAASGSFTAEVTAAFAGDSCSEAQLMLLQDRCSSRCGSCNNSGSSRSAAAAAGDVGGAVEKVAVVRSTKHVAFSASCSRSLNGLEEQQQQQQQQRLSPFAAAANDAAGAVACKPSLAVNSDPLPRLLVPGNAAPQQQQHWQPLTTSALRRLSVDIAYSGAGSGSIPLALQLQGAGSSSRPGSCAGSAAYARVAVPSSALQRASPAAAAAAAGTAGGGSDSGVAAGLSARSQSGGCGGCYDDVSDILAAANMERDYEVS